MMEGHVTFTIFIVVLIICVTIARMYRIKNERILEEKRMQMAKNVDDTEDADKWYRRLNRIKEENDSQK